MLLVNTEDAVEKAEKVLYWATQAREPARWYQHTEIGYNYRMSNVVAGIGRGQLKVLDRRIEKKRAIFEFYQRRLAELSGLSFMPMPENAFCNCWLSVIQLEKDCPVKPLDIMKSLEDEDVESRPVWKPMHLQPVFAGCEFLSREKELFITDKETGADNSVSGQLLERGVCLPSDTKMSEEDQEQICRVLEKLW